ncbi:MAG: glycosyltransferase [Bacillota bacterium]
MIVKNEEETLQGCLDSIQPVADEIIIVDTGSTDRTKEVAARYTNKIFDFEWIDDFAAARNFAFSHASMEYIMWLDADDILLEKDRLLSLKDNFDRTVDAVTMPYHIAFDEHGNVTVNVRRSRLVKRENNYRWIGPVHEYLEVGGKIWNSDIIVAHHRKHSNSSRNLKIYENRERQGEHFNPRDLFYYANELADHQNHQKAITYYKKFLDCKQGWVEDIISACSSLADIYFHLNDKENELYYITKSFEYDLPRAEFCCRLGYHFLQNSQLTQAVYWYRTASELEKPEESWGFFNDTCWTWLPHLQLCICYYRLGDNEKAYYHNEIARGYRPNDENILHNKRFFEGIMNIS